VVANIIIIVTCHRHERIGKTLSRQLIYYQTLADLIGNLAFLFLSPYEEIQCNFMGTFIFIMNMSAVLWTVVMSFVLQMVTNQNQNPIFQASQYFLFYHIFCWIFPIVLSLLPYAHGLKCFIFICLTLSPSPSFSPRWLRESQHRMVLYFQ
jgi:hypothetical protein